MKNAVICGTGSYLPERSVTNIELQDKLNTSDEWIFTRTGIRSRYIANENETTSFMASQAAQKAVANAELDPNKIDLIIVATCTPDYFFPSMACHVQKALNIKKPIPAFDISAACSGFVYVMDIAKQYITSGAARYVLVVGSESMSRALDWTDRSTCVLFGDGAAAVLLGASDEPGIIGSVLHSCYDEEKLLTYSNYQGENKPLIGMRGNAVFKVAVNMMENIVDEVLSASGLQKADIDWLIPHQANIRIIQAIAKKIIFTYGTSYCNARKSR